MKRYDLRRLITTVFIGAAVEIWMLMQLLQGQMIALFWMILGVFLTRQGLKTALKKEAYAEERRKEARKKQVYRKLFGPCAPVMPSTPMIAFLVAAASCVFHPPIWLYVLLLGLAAAYTVWFIWFIGKHVKEEQAQ